MAREFVGYRQQQILKHRSDITSETDDVLVTEEPLSIYLELWENGAYVSHPLTTTMRTPGNDVLLAIGFLFSEGIIEKREDIVSIEKRGPFFLSTNSHNRVCVRLDRDITLDKEALLARNFLTTSSCGVCGKRSIDDLLSFECEVNRVWAEIPSLDFIELVQDKIKESSHLFQKTGSVHCSALSDSSGKVLSLHEDVGRHNALDKLAGACLLDALNEFSEQFILFLSGRISYELVQKAHRLGIRTIVAIGAPSTLAVDLAQRARIRLLGFARGGMFNVYTGDV